MSKRPIDYFREGYENNGGDYKDAVNHNEEAQKEKAKILKARIESGEASAMELLQVGFKNVDKARQAEEEKQTSKGYNLSR